MAVNLIRRSDEINSPFWAVNEFPTSVKVGNLIRARLMRRWDGENRLSNRFTMPRDGNANYRENDDEVVREIEIL